MFLSKEIYQQIIGSYYKKDLNSVLYYFCNYNPECVKKTVIRLIIKTTLDFDLAIELNDSSSLSRIKEVLIKVFLLDFIKFQQIILSKDDIKKIKKDSLYLKFKPLFLNNLNLYNNCYYYKFIKPIQIPSVDFHNYPKQTLDEINFKLSFHKDYKLLNDLLINDKVYLNDLYITETKIIIKNNDQKKCRINNSKKIEDIQLEELFLYHILRIKYKLIF